MAERERREPNQEVKEGDFCLESFLVEPKTDYSELIKKVDRESGLGIWPKDALFTQHSSNLTNSLEPHWKYTGKVETERKKAVSFFRKKVNDKILVDLGAGQGGRIEDLAQELGAAVYIRVDKFYPEDKNIPLDPTNNLSPGKRARKVLLPTKTDRMARLGPEGKMQIATVKADLLDFISRLPDSSVCVTINGIDGSIIENDDYHKALAKEIVRVTANDGIAFGNTSNSLEEAAEDPSVVEVKPLPLQSGHTVVLEKK